jgi:hypothetical protein
MLVDGLGNDLPRPASIDVIFEDPILPSSFPDHTIRRGRLRIVQKRAPDVCFL